ncbi:hypothetical protein LTR40_006310 [Exophiala xenobiotica]|nr:hypothetical protein LTR40_006310 [Exophiala xenobiotica]
MASKIDVGGGRTIMAGASVAPYEIVTVELKWTEGEQREYLDFGSSVKKNREKEAGVQKRQEEYASINSGRYQGIENTRADPTPNTKDKFLCLSDGGTGREEHNYESANSKKTVETRHTFARNLVLMIESRVMRMANLTNTSFTGQVIDQLITKVQGSSSHVLPLQTTSPPAKPAVIDSPKTNVAHLLVELGPMVLKGRRQARGRATELPQQCGGPRGSDCQAERTTHKGE